MYPVIKTRTIPESEYRTLLERTDEAKRLGRRVADLERTLLESEVRASLAKDAVEEVLESLLPTLDDFDRALDAVHAGGGLEAIASGVELVRSEMDRVLSRFALERIPSRVGEPFDPSIHQDLDGSTGPGDDGRVLEELRPGYRRGKKILRRALVRVELLSAE